MEKKNLKRFGGVTSAVLILCLTTGICWGQVKPITISLGATAVHPSPSASIGERFKEVLEMTTATPVEVKFYPASQLGSAMEQRDGVLTGAINMMYEDLGVFEAVLPELKVFSMPYLIKNPEHFQKVLKSPVGEKISDGLTKKGLKLINAIARPPRNLTANKPIRTLEDLKGFKIRVPDFATYIDIWRTLGANPTPMAWSEVYGALATGIVEGQENPCSVFYATKLYEVQKYVILTEHLPGTSYLVANNKWFSNLPKGIQESMYQAADLTLEYIAKLEALRENVILTILKEKGMTIIRPDLSPWREAVKGMYKKYGSEFSPALYEEIQKLGRK